MERNVTNMRKRFTESRTYEEAYMIGKQRIDDAIKIYDSYSNRGGDFIKRPCPFCGCEKYENVESFQNRYGISKCLKCSSLYVNPCPTQEVLNDYYNNYECNTMLEKVYKERAQKPENTILDTRIETIISYINKIAKDNVNILEVGCSNGSFLSRLRKRIQDRGINKDITYIGVDANDNAVKACHDESITLISSTIEDYLESTDTRFDIVWHSELIEHLIDPYNVFKKINYVMNEGGYMIFTTPNSASVEMKNISYNVPRVLACNILPPMHLNAFSTNNIAHFVFRSGFFLVDISTPGQFDVEILEMEKEHLNNKYLLQISKLTEEEKEMVQEILIMGEASSHMQCIVMKEY